jgi:outer membrane protein TolC
MKPPVIATRALAARDVLPVLAAALAACGPYQHYRPAPPSGAPAAVSAAFRARALSDARLAAFVAAHDAPGETPPGDSGWSPRQLALAALYQRAELAEARAVLAAAAAAARTAGLRPEPSASASAERASRADEGKSSPWTASLTAGVTLETGGKRAARVARARAATLGARLRLDAAGWEAAQGAARSAVALAGAERELRDADAEAAALRSVLELLRARYAEGRITLADLALAETAVRSATVAAVQARRARTDARLALARALAVPLGEVARLVVRVEGDAHPAPGCGVLDTLGAAALQTLALQRRFDLGAALADYAVTEADVRAEVARQYPDLTLGPGIAWDEGVLRWALAAGTPAIPRARNRGPIAEALARRAAQGARVRVVQDSTLATLDAAAADCADARLEVAATDSLREAARRELEVAEAAYRRGETGRTEVALATLASVRAERAFQQAAQRRRAAGAALESAAGTWLSGPPPAWPDLSAPPTPRDADGDRR